MDKLEITKKAVSTVVGLSVTFVVSAVLKNNVSPDTLAKKGGVQVGSFVLGAMVAEKAQDYAQDQVVKMVDWWKNNSNKTAE